MTDDKRPRNLLESLAPADLPVANLPDTPLKCGVGGPAHGQQCTLPFSHWGAHQHTHDGRIAAIWVRGR